MLSGLALLYILNLAPTVKSGLIDDIMDKLLTSEKMDKLVDKIAIKAAEKIVDMTHVGGASVPGHGDGASPTDHAGEIRERADDGEPTKLDHETFFKNFVNDSTKPKSETRKHQNDTEDYISGESLNTPDQLAVMEEYASIPKEKVNMNYQRFTTKNDTKDTTEANLKQMIESDEKAAEADMEKEKTEEHKIKKKGSKKKGSKKKRKRSKKRKSSKSESPTTLTTEKELDEYDTVYDSINDKKDTNVKVDDSKNIKSSTPDSAKTPEQSDSDSDKNEIVTTDGKIKTDSSTKKSSKKKSKKVKTKSVESDFLHLEMADVVGNVSDTKKIVRQQGEKLYAFVDNDDYKEYHEELAKKIHKSRKKTPDTDENSSNNSN